MVVLSLGSNLGNRFANMQIMERETSHLLGGEILKSPLYETAPVGVSGHSPYLNRIIAGYFSGTPEELLEKTQQIEKELGRNTKGNLAPRTADIDILLFNDLEINKADLIIPHHSIFERHFEIAGTKAVVPEQLIPGQNINFSEYEIRSEVKAQVITIIE